MNTVLNGQRAAFALSRPTAQFARVDQGHCCRPSMFRVLIALMLLSSCGKVDPGMMLCAIGVTDEDPAAPLWVDLVADPTVEGWRQNVAAQVSATAGDIAARPGSVLRIICIANTESAASILATFTAPASKSLTAEGRAAEERAFVADVEQRSQKALEVSEDPPVVQSLIAEGIQTVALDPPPAKYRHIVLVVTDGREVRKRSAPAVRHPTSKADLDTKKAAAALAPQAKKHHAHAPAVPKHTPPTIDDDGLDLECNAGLPPDKFLAYLDHWKLLAPASLSNVTITFSFMSLRPVAENRCVYGNADLEAARRLWTAALQRAGARVHFSSGVFHVAEEK